MLKTDAIALLGGSVSEAAKAIGASYQAVNKWPDVLTQRIADRVIGACVRLGIEVPSDCADLAAPAKEVT